MDCLLLLRLCTRLIGIVRTHHKNTTTISEILRVIFHVISVLLKISIYIFFTFHCVFFDIFAKNLEFRKSK